MGQNIGFGVVFIIMPIAVLAVFPTFGHIGKFGFDGIDEGQIASNQA